MSNDGTTVSSSLSAEQRARRLRVVAILILLLGIAGAEVVYFFWK
jgi:hypothetical protein